MNSTTRHLAALALIFLLTMAAGCSDRDTSALAPARGAITDPLVFDDAYSSDVYGQAFFETNIWAVSIDSVYAYGGLAADGARSLKVNVPAIGSALGLYSGGVLTAGQGRDLGDFNALTFYARANSPLTLNLAGFGNDNTGTSLFEASRNNIAIGPDWSFVVLPIPNSARLLSERGLFTYAKSLEESLPQGFDIWFDEIRYAKLSNIAVTRATMTSAVKPCFVGSTVNISGCTTIFRVGTPFVIMNHSPGYFDLVSSNPAVASVRFGKIMVNGTGNSVITGTLPVADADTTLVVQGRIDVTGYNPPAVAATAPTLPAADVISLFSDEYNDVLVDTWRADWGGVTTEVQDYTVAGNNTKMYSSLNWVGIQFLTRTIDATDMTHLHLDVYAPAGTLFKVELGSLPPDATNVAMTPNGIVLNATTTPPFVAEGWSSLDIPLENFQIPAAGWDWGYLAQMVLSSTDAKLVLVDNVYFHR